MNPLTGLMDKLRTQIDGIGDAVRGSDAEHALPEQMQAVSEQIREWRSLLDALKAQAFVTQERVTASDAKLALREAQAVAALEAGEQALAREVAEAIVALQDTRAVDVLNLEETGVRRVQLEALVEHGENDLRRLRHQVDLVRAATAVARSEEAVRAQGDAPHGIPTAIDSAELLRARRVAGAETPADAVGTAPTDDDLDARLAEAGVAAPSPVDAVLARLATRVAAAKKSPRPRARRSARKDTP